MGSFENLTQQDALKKIKALAEDIKICMLCTKAIQLPFDARPMATQQVDEKGDIWFFSGADSIKNEEIEEDADVQLIYAKPSDSKFLTVYGHANIIRNSDKTEELWNSFVKAWFPEGKNDPNLTLIRVRPEVAHYWDTKDGKMISLLKIATAALTGKSNNDGGVEGNLLL